MQLLHALCEHIAIALHNCRRFRAEQEQRQRMTRESEEARIIQQALLPKVSPYVPGFAISGLSVPAGDIGGDWYDFIPFNGGCWGLVLADVSGKGTAAALLMSATRAMLRSLADTCSSPAETLQKMNQLMVEDFPLARFVTLIYAFRSQKSNLQVRQRGAFASAVGRRRSRPLSADPNLERRWAYPSPDFRRAKFNFHPARGWCFTATALLRLHPSTRKNTLRTACVSMGSILSLRAKAITASTGRNREAAKARAARLTAALTAIKLQAHFCCETLPFNSRSSCRY